MLFREADRQSFERVPQEPPFNAFELVMFGSCTDHAEAVAVAGVAGLDEGASGRTAVPGEVVPGPPAHWTSVTYRRCGCRDHAEADVVVGKAGLDVVARGRPADPGVVVPGPTAQ